MSQSQSFDLIVIGAGPAGYVAAIRAAQLGMNVACVEKEATLGGTCLNVGCIPSKALLESSELYYQAKTKFKDHGIGTGEITLDFPKFMERKNQVVKQLTGGIAGLFKKNKITRFAGIAQIHSDKKVTITSGAEKIEISAKKILIASGSTPISIPGISINQKNIVDSTGALSLSEIPQKLIVIGGGYIGLELGSVYLRLGTEVTVVEAFERIVPAMDLEISKALQKTLQKQGMKFLLSTKVLGVQTTKKGDVLMKLNDAQGKESELEANVVLVSVGRKPCTEGLGLKEAGIQMDEKGCVVVNKHFETSVSGIYAVGDVIAGPMLAHKASEEGVAAVEIMAGQAGHVNYQIIPGVVYTWPEVASVGITEEQAKEQKLDYKVSQFPFMANGRSLSMGEKDGFVKLIADKKTDRLLGAHIIGPRASDMIAEVVLGMEFSTSGEDIARTVHAHPTLPEVLKEAALGLGEGAIHF